MPFRAIEDVTLRQTMSAAYDLAIAKLGLDAKIP